MASHMGTRFGERKTSNTLRLEDIAELIPQNRFSGKDCQIFPEFLLINFRNASCSFTGASIVATCLAVP